MKVLFTVAAACASVVSFAQFSDNFESETGSAGGTLATGQNGWYLPSGTDMNIYSYSGNSLGLVNNPNGNSQFLGGVSQGGSTFARAEHAMTFSGGVWTISFDFNGSFSGTLPTADNLGSFSLQPSASADYFQTLYAWGANTTTATQFNAQIGVFGSAGGAIAFNSPGAAWNNLFVNHWYHQTVTFDFGTNQVLDTTLQDITANGSLNDFQPTGWYLAGGANNALGLALPTAARFFAGGNAGNTMGYDNFRAVAAPEPASLALLGLGALALLRRRKR